MVETEEKDEKSEETIVPDQIDEQEVPSITILVRFSSWKGTINHTHF